jgi:lincosamide nucleotidyltransferase A/C/D/E
MEAAEVVRLLTLVETDDVTVWLDGGWGVDARLERQTRVHDDLDLIVELPDVSRLTALLEAGGYEAIAGTAPRSFVAVDAAGRQVDVHPVFFDAARGGGVYQMEDGGEWVYPSAGFAGHGNVAGRPVRCLSADAQVLVHDGYELTDRTTRSCTCCMRDRTSLRECPLART